MHLYIMRLTDSPLCRRWGAEEETSAHVLCECEALATLRHFFWTLRTPISLGAIWNFKGTGLPWLELQLKGHKGPVKGLRASGPKGLHSLFILFYSILRPYACYMSRHHNPILIIRDEEYNYVAYSLQIASCTTGTGSFPGVKRSGRGVDHPPHLAPRLKKLYLYSPSGSSYVLGWTLPFTASRCFLNLKQKYFPQYPISNTLRNAVLWQSPTWEANRRHVTEQIRHICP
jgi:hypothetical protein